MLIILCILPLLLVPVFYKLAEKSPRSFDFLDGFTLTAVLGLVFFGVLPEGVEKTGPWVMIAALFGFLVPSIIENTSHKAEELTHSVGIWIVGFGLALHSFLDGVGIKMDFINQGIGDLSLAIFLHQLPVGLGVWISANPKKHPLKSLALLLFLILSTLLGYFITDLALVEVLNSQFSVLFQSMIAGSLVHILYHKQHKIHESCAHETNKPQWFQGFGSVFGIFSIICLTIFFSHHENHHENHFLENYLSLFFLFAPFFGFMLLFSAYTSAIQKSKNQSSIGFYHWFNLYLIHKIPDKFAPWILLTSLPLVYILSLNHLSFHSWLKNDSLFWGGLPFVILLSILGLYSLIKRGSRRFIHEVIPCSSLHEHHHSHHH